MKMTTINETALAAAMDHILGPDARREVEDLYAVIDKAHADAFVWGRTSIDIESVRAQGFRNGYNVGYEDGKAVATGTEQPWEFDGAPMLLLPYYGDSGDEAPDHYEMADEWPEDDGFYDATHEDLDDEDLHTAYDELPAAHVDGAKLSECPGCIPMSQRLR